MGLKGMWRIVMSGLVPPVVCASLINYYRKLFGDIFCPMQHSPWLAISVLMVT